MKRSEIDNACTCGRCRKMCKRRPCWGTPEEIEELIAAGFAKRLMLDYWEADNRLRHTDIVAPAVINYEGKSVPFFPLGRCTFLTEEELCQLHELDLKPLEGGRATCRGSSTDDLHLEIAKMWAGTKGRRVVATWQRKKNENNKSD